MGNQRTHGRRLVAAAMAAAVAPAALLAWGGTAALAAPAAVGATVPVVGAPAARHVAGPARQPGTAGSGGLITTVAGGVGGPGPATSVSLYDSGAGPQGLAFAAGHLYIADGVVRQVDAQTGRLTTPVGTGAAGPLGTGGPATRASVSAGGVAVDHAGNLVMTDFSAHRVWVAPATTGTFYGQAMTAGHIYVVAGNGGAGAGGSGVPATKTPLNSPQGVAVDAAGNLVIADQGRPQAQPPERGSRIRVVAASTGTFYGQAMTFGDIYTVAGSAKGAEFFTGAGGPARKATLGDYIFGVAVDAAGNLVIGDDGANLVLVVAARTGTFYGQAMTAGHIYVVAGAGTGGDGGPALHASLNGPTGVALDQSGNLLIGDQINNRVRVVAENTGTFYGQAMTAGDIYTVAGGGTGSPHNSGDGGSATAAVLAFPTGVMVDPAGNLVIADWAHERVRVVATTTGTFYGQAMTAGDIYNIAGRYQGSGASDFCCDGAPATAAGLWAPASATADHAGNIVISDSADNRIRVVAAATGSFYGIAMTKGNIYTVAGNGKGRGVIGGFPATQTDLGSPTDVQVDHLGNLLIALPRSGVIGMLPTVSGTYYGVPMTAGNLYAVTGNGGGLSGPTAGVVDAAGNLVIADAGSNRIRVVAARTGTFYGHAMTVGDVYTVAGNGTFGFTGDGGPATSAELAAAGSVAVDAAGNLVIADTVNDRIRVVAVSTGAFYGQAMTAGDIYTVAGNGTAGFAGDGGPATSAEFHNPVAVAVDGAGNLVVADTHADLDPAQVGNNRVRVIAATTGTFYGVHMTAGDIYTVAGNGTAGFAGDGGAATRAELNNPVGVGFDGAGDLLVADANSQRIREIAR